MGNQSFDPHARFLELPDQLVLCLLGLLTSLDELAGALELHESSGEPATEDDRLLVDALLGLLSLHRTLHVWLAPILQAGVEASLEPESHRAPDAGGWLR